MTEGVIGLGTILKIGDGATPEVFTAIAEVKDITGPGQPASLPSLPISNLPAAAANTSQRLKTPGM
jgi:hypothetical protein